MNFKKDILCDILEIINLEVESDSLVAVRDIIHKRTENWKYIYIMRHCLAHGKNLFEIRHVFRQSNVAADRCADWVHSHKTRRECFIVSELPLSIRAALTDDRLGIWNFRK